MTAIRRIINDTNSSSKLTAVCLTARRRVLKQVEKTKEAVAAEFREALENNKHLLHLALNEAEALAWETGFPHLVFPVLATEKAEAVAAWHARQQEIQQRNAPFAFAA